MGDEIAPWGTTASIGDMFEMAEPINLTK